MWLGSRQQAAAVCNTCHRAAPNLQVYIHSRPAWPDIAALANPEPASCHTLDRPALAMTT